MNNMYSYDYQFRLIVVGDATVGKVSVLTRMPLTCMSLSGFSPRYYGTSVMESFLTIQ